MVLPKNKIVLFIPLVIVLLFVLYKYNPITSGIYPRCVSYSLFSINCPGCGTLRAIHHLFNGEIIHSIKSNILIYITIVYMLVRSLISKLREQSFIINFSSREISGMMIFIIIYTIARNIPIEPFNILAP